MTDQTDRVTLDVEALVFTHDITLPRIIGTRPAAAHYLESLPGDLSGAYVRLDCSGLTEGTMSFADEVVRVVLAEGRAALLVAVGPPDEFAQDLKSAVGDYEVIERFRLIDWRDYGDYMWTRRSLVPPQHI